MVAPVLNPYEYQFTDTGVLLNNSTALPFIDISNIQGLDLPAIDSVDSEYDSRHGGYVYSRFVKIRTIVLDGTLYANAASIDTTIETLIANFMPRTTDAPFYYRGAGVAQRYIMCKPVGFNFNITALRNNGSCDIQIQLKAGDPVKYVDDADLPVTSGTAYAITNNGNVETFPKFDITGAAAEVVMVNTDTGETVTHTFTTDADDSVVIDFKTRSCTLNGVKNSSYLTSLGWWSFPPGVATNFKLLATAAEAMVNGGCEADFGAGYAVGANWTGTQQSTADKHSGSKSLRMVRKNKTAGSGTVTVPTTLTGLVAGSYTASVWVKGTMPNITVLVQNAGATVATATLFAVSSTTWRKVQLSFTLAAVSGAMTFVLNDTGQAASKLAKGKTLYMDDFSFKPTSATVTAVVSSKDGWL